MKILFVSSGNSLTGINQIVKNQGDSLIAQGIDLEYYTISKKGFIGYLIALIQLRNLLSKYHLDLLHAHYSLSGIVAKLATRKPIIVSLMGSDLHVNIFLKQIILLFSKFLWDAVIVKTEEMRRQISGKNVYVIPNGVNLEHFKLISKEKAINEIGYDESKKNILFISYSYKNEIRSEKNYKLAEEAVNQLNDPNVKLNILTYADYCLMPYYYCASDILLFTSLREGSPNVIKEAMACNLPIVATNVGDIKYLFENTNGYYITDFNAIEIASKLRFVLDNNIKSNGRERIISIQLDSFNIANKINSLYKELLKNKANENY